MGWYVAGIGKYYMRFHDSIHDHVRRSKDLNYFKNYKVDTQFYYTKDDGSEHEEIVKIPLSNFGKPILLKKLYEFSFNINLKKVLFNELRKREITPHGVCSVDVHIGDSKFVTYYLHSEIGNNKIELRNDGGVIHFIHKYKDLEWLLSNGLTLEE